MPSSPLDSVYVWVITGWGPAICTCCTMSHHNPVFFIRYLGYFYAVTTKPDSCSRNTTSVWPRDGSSHTFVQRYCRVTCPCCDFVLDGWVLPAPPASWLWVKRGPETEQLPVCGSRVWPKIKLHKHYKLRVTKTSLVLSCELPCHFSRRCGGAVFDACFSSAIVTVHRMDATQNRRYRVLVPRYILSF